METNLHIERLTDHSKVYSVDIVDGSAVARLHCVNYGQAVALQDMLSQIAYATVEGIYIRD